MKTLLGIFPVALAGIVFAVVMGILGNVVIP